MSDEQPKDTVVTLSTEDNSTYPECPDCGAPLVDILRHIPNSVVREYRCGVRWLDVDDRRKQAALSGSPLPCRYVREMRATVERLTRERDEAIQQRVDDVQAAQDRAEAFIEEHTAKLRRERQADTAIVAAAQEWRDAFLSHDAIRVVQASNALGFAVDAKRIQRCAGCGHEMTPSRMSGPDTCVHCHDDQQESNGEGADDE